MKKHLSTILLVLILLLGVGILLYPTISDYWNSFHQSRAIANYIEEMEAIDPADYEREWAKAREYNRKLPLKPNRFMFTDEDYAEYESLLNLTAQYLLIDGFFFPALLVIFVYRNSLQGLGYSREAMLAGVFELIGRVFVASLLVGRFGFTAACFASPAAWVAAGALLLTLYWLKMGALIRREQALERVHGPAEDALDAETEENAENARLRRLPRWGLKNRRVAGAVKG